MQCDRKLNYRSYRSSAGTWAGESGNGSSFQCWWFTNCQWHQIYWHWKSFDFVCLFVCSHRNIIEEPFITHWSVPILAHDKLLCWICVSVFGNEFRHKLAVRTRLLLCASSIPSCIQSFRFSYWIGTAIIFKRREKLHLRPTLAIPMRPDNVNTFRDNE